MKMNCIQVLTFVAGILLLSCESGQKYQENAAVESGSSAPEKGLGRDLEKENAIGSSLTSGSRPSPQDRFVRFAEIRFRAKDVGKTTAEIEKAAVFLGGYVESSELTNEKERVEETSLSPDSTLETTYFTVRSDIWLRIPVQHLDSSLALICQKSEVLELKKVTAENIGIDYLAQQLEENRSVEQVRRIESGAKGNKGNLKAENNRYQLLSQRDQAWIEQMHMEEKINLCKVHITMYQRTSRRTEVLANSKNVEAFKPGFFSQLGEAFSEGGNWAKELVLILAKIWVFILIAAISIFVAKRSGRRSPALSPSKPTANQAEGGVDEEKSE